jgi:hypothetical protein
LEFGLGCILLRKNKLLKSIKKDITNQEDKTKIKFKNLVEINKFS